MSFHSYPILWQSTRCSLPLGEIIKTMSKNSTNTPFQFDNTYLSLPSIFYSKTHPSQVKNPATVLFNSSLNNNLGISFSSAEEIAPLLSGNQLAEGSVPFAQAYAGHQFGHFTMLGDGRAIVLGEHITQQNERLDVQLKGSGQTPYSRRGDGKASVKAMLREYLMSEAMHFLDIPTSRSLAVIATGEPIYRETVQEAAVLTRIMRSHIRVGTFEYARYFTSPANLESLLHYTINRHFPELKNATNPALALLEQVMKRQISLIVEWMRVGFIHGVMNTDNTSIIGDTFDYGPCAFMNAYHPDTVFSSIDSTGRYAYGNQPKIIKWNMAKLAEALLPLIHDDEDTAIKLAVDVLNTFDEIYTQKWYNMMFAKIGITTPQEHDDALVHELLNLMRAQKADYTNTFNYLSGIDVEEMPWITPWHNKWLARIGNKRETKTEATLVMQKVNPVIVPRNQFVEEALQLAENGDLSAFNMLLEALKTPYTFTHEKQPYLKPDISFDESYQTFCGT